MEGTYESHIIRHLLFEDVATARVLGRSVQKGRRKAGKMAVCQGPSSNARTPVELDAVVCVSARQGGMWRKESPRASGASKWAGKGAGGQDLPQRCL